MKQYHDLLRHILETGETRQDRTGTGTLSIFGYQMRFDLREGFPVVTTKKVHMKSVIHELIWMLSGHTSVKYLNDNGVTIWNEWADSLGYLGPIYGYQWRKSYDEFLDCQIDQIANIQRDLVDNPYCRRHILSAWNVAHLSEMALQPCHMMCQFYVSTSGELDCHLYMRSSDTFLGLPFNIAQYALLTEMFASVTGLKARNLTISFGDAHIYLNHVEQVKLQLTRDFMPLPTIALNPDIKNVWDFTYNDITLSNYNHHPAIKGDVAV